MYVHISISLSMLHICTIDWESVHSSSIYAPYLPDIGSALAEIGRKLDELGIVMVEIIYFLMSNPLFFMWLVKSLDVIWELVPSSWYSWRCVRRPLIQNSNFKIKLYNKKITFNSCINLLITRWLFRSVLQSSTALRYFFASK